MPLSSIHFLAKEIAFDTDPACFIAFADGDPESGGYSWNFSRLLDDDWGVCTVREIQQCTFYEGIAEFELSPRGVVCRFDDEGRAEARVSSLHIDFLEIDDDTWRQLANVADIVFQDRPYYHRSET